MSDYAEADADFCWESRYSKTDSKGRKGLKHKSDVALKKDGSIQKKKKKKKKSSKFKEVMKESKDKKKETKKKKKKKRGLDHSFIFTQGSAASEAVAQWATPEPLPSVKPAASKPGSPETQRPGQLTWDFKKKSKTKKKVAFDLSPGCIRVKRPKVVSPPPRSPLENEAARDKESLWHGTVTGQSQAQLPDNDSQSTGDDINSQDLFITQKTFRAPPSEPSSEESNDESIAATPLTLAQQGVASRSPLTQEQRHEGPDIMHLQAQNKKLLHFHQQPRKAEQHPKEPLKVCTLPVGKPKGVHTSRQAATKETPYFQVQMELSRHLTEETKALHPKHIRPKEDAYLDVTKPQKDFCTSTQKLQRSPPCLQEPFPLAPISTSNTSTQTENFFTTELSSYLGFSQQRRATISCEHLKPLDLSLPQRARADPGRRLLFSVKTSVIEIKDDDDTHADQRPASSPVKIKDEPSKRPLCSSGVKNNNGQKEPLDQWSSTTQGRDETTQSPLSLYESKSSDTTITSEDNEPSWHSSKVDLTQVRAVQTRLNESFFFKPKGEGQSPRPESPLMKLAQSREKKSRKSH